MPCSNCHRNGRSCIIDPSQSNSCSECVCRKVSCDGVDVGARLMNAMKECHRLEEEEDKLMQELVELQSRLLCTREQKRHMQTRQKELFDRGMVEHEKEVRELEVQRVANNLPSDEAH